MPQRPSPSVNRRAPSATSSSGFTLVEMSIVLVLIGLLVGGLITAKNVIRSAELKTISEEVGALRQVVSTFKDRYGSYPGDMFNATKFWGVQNADHATCVSTKSTSNATCNGDGNGWVTTHGVGSTYFEAHRFWQHLTNAGLLSGRYSGEDVTSDAYANCNVTSHCGMAKYQGGLFYAASIFRNYDYFNTPTEALNLYPGDDKGNAIIFFGSKSSADPQGAYVGAPILPTADAMNLDEKMDDGNPGTGYIQTFQPLADLSYLANNCALADAPNPDKYNIRDDKATCALVFTNAF